VARSVDRYAPATRALHWLVALVVIVTLPVGGIMTGEGLSRETQNALFIFHKNIGVVILLLVAARLVLRALQPAPPMPAHMPSWQRLAAVATHWGLYGLLVVMAVSGYIRVEAGNFPIEGLDALGIPPLVPVNEALAKTAQSIHSTARYALAGLILLHVAAALQHGLLKRDGVFGRIWPPLGR
jgi:cytochrome b561